MRPSCPAATWPNLAVFAGTRYPHTWAGLVQDFTAALPDPWYRDVA